MAALKWGSLGMKQKINSRGRAKYIVTISIAVIISMVIVGVSFSICFDKIAKMVLEKDIEQMEKVSYYVTQIIQGEINRCVELMDTSEEVFHDVRDYDVDEVVRYLGTIREKANFKRMGIVDLNGKSIDDTGSVSVAGETDLLVHIRNNEIYISNIIGVSDNIIMAIPIHRDEEVVGAVWGQYAVSTISDKIEMSGDSYRYFQIIDNNGVYISASSNVNSFAKSPNLWEEMQRYDFPEGTTIEEIQSNVENGESGYFHFTYNGEGRYVTYEPLGINNWYVFSVLVEDYLVDYINEIEHIFSLLLSGVLICVAIISGSIGVLIYRLISRMKEKNDQLFVKNSLLSMLIKKTKDVLFELDFQKDQLRIYHNDEGEEGDCEIIHDFSPENLLKSGRIRACDYETYKGAYEKLRRGESVEPFVIGLKMAGEWEYSRVHGLTISKDYLVGFLEDYNEQMHRDMKIEEITEKGRIDLLTTVYTREYFIEKLESILNGAPDEAEKGVSALFLIDVDHFKEVNDMLGHMIGDRALHEIGEKMKTAIKSTDFAGRLGGDEFVLFIQNEPDVSAIKAFAEKLNAVLTLNYLAKEKTITTSVSIGIVIVQEEKTFHELYEMADQALYEVKKNQRNGYKIAEK